MESVSDVNRRIQRIVAGDLRERLPARGSDDPFDQLAVSVNGMLGEIETLIHEIAGVGDDIAHDLRRLPACGCASSAGASTLQRWGNCGRPSIRRSPVSTNL